MLFYFFLQILFKEVFTEAQKDIDDTKSLSKNLKDVNFLEINSGKGLCLEHKGRKFSFMAKEDEKAAKIPEILDKFEPTYSDIVEISQNLRKLGSESEHDEIKRGGRSFAIFFLNEEYISKLKVEDSNLKVFLSTDRELAKKLGTPFPGIHGYNSSDKVEYSLNVREDYFRAANSIITPLLDVITGENMKLYEMAENPTFYILSYLKDHKSLKSEFRDTALKLKNEAQICLMEYERGKTKIEGVGLKEEDLPAMLIIIKNSKYREPKVTPEKAESFIKGFQSKKLSPFLLSGVEPADNNERPVKIIVCNGRENWLDDKEKDKLVVFQAPWCRFCKELKPVIESLASKAHKYARDKVTIGTVDMTENEIPEFDIKSYPTLYLIKAKTNEKVLFSGKDRTLEAFIDFLKTNGNHKVDLEVQMSKQERKEL